jgi:hypothetical protein
LKLARLLLDPLWRSLFPEMSDYDKTMYAGS